MCPCTREGKVISKANSAWKGSSSNTSPAVSGIGELQKASATEPEPDASWLRAASEIHRMSRRADC